MLGGENQAEKYLEHLNSQIEHSVYNGRRRKWSVTALDLRIEKDLVNRRLLLLCYGYYYKHMGEKAIQSSRELQERL